MLTAAQYAALTDEEARDRLNELGAARYGTDRWRAMFERETGTNRRTVANWIEGRPPYWPVALLQEAAVSEERRIACEQVASSLNHLWEAAEAR